MLSVHLNDCVNVSSIVSFISEAAPPLCITPCPALVSAVLTQVPGPGSVLRVPLVWSQHYGTLVWSQPAHLNTGVKTEPRERKNLNQLSKLVTSPHCQLGPCECPLSSELCLRHVQVKTINNTSSPVITTDQSKLNAGQVSAGWRLEGV